MKYPNQRYRNGMSIFVGAVIMGAWQIGTQVVRRRKRKRDGLHQYDEKPKRDFTQE